MRNLEAFFLLMIWGLSGLAFMVIIALGFVVTVTICQPLIWCGNRVQSVFMASHEALFSVKGGVA